MPAEQTTLAEVVKQKQYATTIVGKWHLGNKPQFLPTRHGFDSYFGLPYSNDMWPYHPELLKLSDAERRKRYPDLPLYEDETVIDAEVTGQDQDQLTTRYTARAVRFVEANWDRPFFLYLAHSMPHVPLHVSDKFRGRTARGLFGDVIEEIDWSVGQVLDTIERLKLRNRTWVIFTSDNGPWLSYGDHAGSALPFREGKGTSWEGGTRVPCIMRWPGKIPAGRRSDQMMMTIDLLPTIAGQIGAALPEMPIDGLDVWPLLAGKRSARNPHTSYWFYYEQNQLQAVTSGDGRWKLVLPHRYRSLAGRPGGTGGQPANYEQFRVQEPELYDLVRDKEERRDVAAKNPEVVRHLLSEAGKARASLGDSLTKSESR
jgi:arylsulfatase